MANTDYGSVSQFRTFYPEFKTIQNDSVIQYWLDFAEARINKSVWAQSTNIGHLTWTAHLIASSPFGRTLRQQTPDAETVYLKLYEELLAGVSLTTTVCNAGL